MGRTNGSIGGVKLSVSLPEADVTFLDDYVVRQALPSRSAGVQAALATLRVMSLGDMYEAAWDEFAPDQPAWDLTVKDGLTDEAW